MRNPKTWFTAALAIAAVGAVGCGGKDTKATADNRQARV